MGQNVSLRPRRKNPRWPTDGTPASTGLNVRRSTCALTRCPWMAPEGAINPEDVLADLPSETAIVEAAEKVVPEMPVYVRRR